MVKQAEVINILRSKYPYLRENFEVKRIAIFGSFAKGNAKNNSDIDLLVEFRKPIGLKFMELAEYLEKTLGRKTDIITQQGMKGIRIKKVANAIKRSLLYV